MMIYTDGSGLQGMIGASAIIYIDGNKKDELWYQLGTEKQHTVFEGELLAILLGPHLAKQHVYAQPAININIDNQATIIALNNNRPQPVQHILEEIKLAVKQICTDAHKKRSQHNHPSANPPSITLTWVAGHMGSIVNEAADKLAKAAIEFGSSDRNLLPKFLRNTLPSSISPIKQHIELTTKNNTKQWWKRSKRYKRIRAIDPTLPSKNFITGTSDLSRTQTSLLMQLRTGHIPLNQYLHRINRNDTPYCQHCPTSIEDVPHLLLSYSKHALHRHNLVIALKRKAHEVSHLLSDPKAIYHTLNFLNDTGRFEHIYGDISAQLGE
jgi:ribonuclease HI